VAAAPGGFVLSFFYVGTLGFLQKKLGAEFPQAAEDVLMALCEVGFFHRLDKFCCFKELDSSRIEFCIHVRFSTELYCSVCGTIQPGYNGGKCREKYRDAENLLVGCGGTISPTSRAEPKATPPKPAAVNKR